MARGWSLPGGVSVIMCRRTNSWNGSTSSRHSVESWAPTCAQEVVFEGGRKDSPRRQHALLRFTGDACRQPRRRRRARLERHVAVREALEPEPQVAPPLQRGPVGPDAHEVRRAVDVDKLPLEALLAVGLRGLDAARGHLYVWDGGEARREGGGDGRREREGLRGGAAGLRQEAALEIRGEGLEELEGCAHDGGHVELADGRVEVPGLGVRERRGHVRQDVRLPPARERPALALLVCGWGRKVE